MIKGYIRTSEFVSFKSFHYSTLGIHPVAMCGHEWPPFAIRKQATIGQDMRTGLMGLPAPG